MINNSLNPNLHTATKNQNYLYPNLVPIFNSNNIFIENCCILIPNKDTKSYGTNTLGLFCTKSIATLGLWEMMEQCQSTMMLMLTLMNITVVDEVNKFILPCWVISHMLSSKYQIFMLSITKSPPIQVMPVSGFLYQNEYLIYLLFALLWQSTTIVLWWHKHPWLG